MSGKVALVTGSTSGLGLGVAHILAKRGCSLILAGSRPYDSVKDTKEELETTYGCKVTYAQSDLSTKCGVDTLCQSIQQHHPSGVDILVNNAGFNHVCQVEEFPEEKWNEMIQVMLTSPFLLIKRLCPLMKSKGWGRIINMSSQMQFVSIPGKAVYSTIKSGIEGLTKGVALELAEYGVTCNNVCPTYVLTPMVEKQIRKLQHEKQCSFQKAVTEFGSIIPTKKLVTVEQVAEMVEFLCFSSASSQITGSSYLIDGGYTAQ